jgi:hypothetical protein
MTDEQIRAEKFISDNGAWECARWLQEIAAQIAELNELYRAKLRHCYGATL